jgi:hypothetical protein
MLTLLSVTRNKLGIPPMPMMVPDSQSMALMTTNLINFTHNTKESGNSSAKAVLPTHLLPFFINFCKFLRVGNTGFLGYHRVNIGHHRLNIGHHQYYRLPMVSSSNNQLLSIFFASTGNFCQSISSNSILTLLLATDSIGLPTRLVSANIGIVLVLYRYPM